MGIGTLLDNGQPLVPGIPKVILWWLALAAVGAFVLAKTRFGNWILAVGGDANAAKNVGVPVRRVKISLFVLTAFCSCLFAVLQVCDIGSAAADRGLQKEFEAIIAAVIGGTLLTGGYGSVIGACFGALIFGVVQIGITYTNVNSDWFRVFLGVMLLIAVLFNHYVRRRVAQSSTRRRPCPRRNRRDADDIILALENVSKYFGKVIALNGVTLRLQARRSALPARRQRRGQVDADQDARRRAYSPPPASIWSTASRCSSSRRKTRSISASPPSIRISRWCRCCPWRATSSWAASRRRSCFGFFNVMDLDTRADAPRATSSPRWASTCATRISRSARCPAARSSVWRSRGRSTSARAC